jgi:hypothetical protein
MAYVRQLCAVAYTEYRQVVHNIPDNNLGFTVSFQPSLRILTSLLSLPPIFRLCARTLAFLCSLPL